MNLGQVPGPASGENRRARWRSPLTGALLVAAVCAGALLAINSTFCIGCSNRESVSSRTYPWHTDIVATVFWVGEILDPDASDGSQVISAYDSLWMRNYGGCDGVWVEDSCETEPRDASNGFFPRNMTPLQNPFYLDLPFDDVNDKGAFSRRGEVVPWANDPGYAGRADDKKFSFMKNRWVRMEKNGSTCYGQIQDAGPGQYNDSDYVFGTNDERPANKKFNGAGMDVSPALAGCLGFQSLNGTQDRLNWQFVEEADVPDGPWKKIVTSTPVVPFGQ
jgi:hypothetical protein